MKFSSKDGGIAIDVGAGELFPAIAANSVRFRPRGILEGEIPWPLEFVAKVGRVMRDRTRMV